MKLILPIALGILSTALAVSLVTSRRDAEARHETQAALITDFSDRLDTARSQIRSQDGVLLTLSNRLNECRSAAAALSNQLAAAQSTVLLQSSQITNLNLQVLRIPGLSAENQALEQKVMDLTDQMAAHARTIALGEASLAQANLDRALVEDRLRQCVAERLVVERKFNNRVQLQTQLDRLKHQPAQEISAEGIYAGLNVELRSDGRFRVLSFDD